MDEQAQSDTRAYGALLLSTVVLALPTWRIAFDLGAHKVVQYENIFAVVVVSIVALAGSFFAPPGTGARSWWSRVLLSAPLGWVVVATVWSGSIPEAATSPVLGLLAVAIAATSGPYVVLLLVRLFGPRTIEIRNRSAMIAMASTVAIVAILGFFVGRANYLFLTCEDFVVAGDHQPANCSPASTN